jgi:DNA repair photolyase
LYCYSRSVFHSREIAHAWGSFVKAKRNIPEVLARELPHKGKGTIGLSTVTDPYQPIESRLQLTRACLEVLKSSGFKVSIQTKSSLVLRDIDLISGPMFEMGVTITTMNQELAKKMEPQASSPDKRRQVLQEYCERKVETWIFLGPIIPNVNDHTEDIEQIVQVAKETRSRLLFDKLNLRPWVLESLTSFLSKETPESLENLPALLGTSSEYWKDTSAKIRALCRDRNVPCETAFPVAQSRL